MTGTNRLDRLLEKADAILLPIADPSESENGL